MLTYAPYFISSVVLVGIVMQVLDPRIGLINQFIQLFGGNRLILWEIRNRSDRFTFGWEYGKELGMGLSFT